MKIGNGRYWGLPWSLISSCTRVSPGCQNCWLLGYEKRFHKGIEGKPEIHPERLDIPLKRKKPTVYAVWSDLHHEAVDMIFRDKAYTRMRCCERHTFLVLTKRPQEIVRFYEWSKDFPFWPLNHIWHGLTVCNQQEANEKIPIFLQVPGKKFLSIEPLLGPVDLMELPRPFEFHQSPYGWPQWLGRKLQAVLCGGETGPGARPMHPDWVRKIRDDCMAVGVDFYFKQWGEWMTSMDYVNTYQKDPPNWTHILPSGQLTGDGLCLSEDGTLYGITRVGRKKAGRTLDGRIHDDLPWINGG